MNYTIDKIENGVAQLISDDGTEIFIKTSLLYKGARENDVVSKTENGFVFLKNETEERVERIEKKLHSLFKKK